MGGISPDHERETEMATMRMLCMIIVLERERGPRHAARRTYQQPARAIMLKSYDMNE